VEGGGRVACEGRCVWGTGFRVGRRSPPGFRYEAPPLAQCVEGAGYTVTKKSGCHSVMYSAMHCDALCVYHPTSMYHYITHGWRRRGIPEEDPRRSECRSA
jgi:hypothetical protein